MSVEVIDTGTGIAPKILERVMDPFFTTKGPQHGTGLGLSVCHSIVQELGGDIHLSSELGAGTTVSVHLVEPP